MSAYSHRHTEAMIKKLEAAGLGYYVKNQSTQDKFGMCIYILIFIYHKCIL